MLKKIKDVIIGSRLAGTVISRKMVVVIGTGVIKATAPKILREFGGRLELTEGWARNVFERYALSEKKRDDWESRTLSQISRRGKIQVPKCNLKVCF